MLMILYILLIMPMICQICVVLFKAHARKQYAMYVWTTGFDVDVPNCNSTDVLRTWDTSSACFTHTWDTASKREWLWDTVNNPGREVSRIFVSGMKTALQAAFDNGNCDGLENIKALMEEGHTLVIWSAFEISTS